MIFETTWIFSDESFEFFFFALEADDINLSCFIYQ